MFAIVDEISLASIAHSDSFEAHGRQRQAEIKTVPIFGRRLHLLRSATRLRQDPFHHSTRRGGNPTQQDRQSCV